MLTRRHPRRKRWWRVGLLTLLLFAVWGIMGSYAASNTVPITYAGDGVIPRSPQQFAPPECYGIPFADIVVVSGTGDGTANNDLILGSANDDTINGQGGDDCIVAGGGSDYIDGGAGDDVILAGPGNDEGKTPFEVLACAILDVCAVRGGSGNDVIYGGPGNDGLSGGDGTDWIDGGSGNGDICHDAQTVNCEY